MVEYNIRVDFLVPEKLAQGEITRASGTWEEIEDGTTRGAAEVIHPCMRRRDRRTVKRQRYTTATRGGVHFTQLLRVDPSIAVVRRFSFVYSTPLLTEKPQSYRGKRSV